MAEEPTQQELETYRKEIAKRIQNHVAETGLRLNPNKKALEALIGGLVKRRVTFGDYYCPCRVVTGDEATDAANVCPCETHQDEVDESGKCHCGLFFAPEVP